MKIAQLRVKIKSLAAEASIIRHEESRFRTPRGYRREAKRILRLGMQIAPLPVDPVTSQEVKDPSCFRVLSNREQVHFERLAQPPSPKQLDTFFLLREHRTVDVRIEARSAQLAMAFLQGKLYRHIEQTDKMRVAGLDAKSKSGYRMVPANPVDCARVAAIATKFAGKGTLIPASAIEEWIDSPAIVAEAA